MNKLLGQTSKADYGSQNFTKHELAIKKILVLFYILFASFILTACSNSNIDPNIVEFRLDSEEVIFYQLSDFDIKLDERRDRIRDEIKDLVNQINYYSENVIELNNDEKKFLFFSYVQNLILTLEPTGIIIRYLFDGNSTFYETNYLSGGFDEYNRRYESVQRYITCNQENICRESSIEERLNFKNSDKSERKSFATNRVEIIAIGNLIYYADSQHHDIAARVALAKRYLLLDGFRITYSRFEKLGAHLAREKIQLSWFREYCSPSLLNCQKIVTILQRYVIDLNNETITFDNDGYGSRYIIRPLGLIDENFNDYFNIHNKNFLGDAYEVNGVFNNEKLNALKHDFSGKEGLENLRNYIFHDKQD